MSRNCDEIYCGRWGKKRRSGLFLERLWRVGELNTADTCQGFWGYNRETFRKKGCLLTNTGGYVWQRVCVSVRVHQHACANAYKMVQRPCNRRKTHFHVSFTHKRLPTTLWKILGTMPCSSHPLGLGEEFATSEQACRRRPLSALFG